jgi:predicted PurR-regulated permease PerM
MLLILGLLVCWAVIYSARRVLKRGFGRATATVATLCTVSLSIAFLFFFVVLINPNPVLKAMHTDLTGAMGELVLLVRRGVFGGYICSGALGGRL